MMRSLATHVLESFKHMHISICINTYMSFQYIFLYLYYMYILYFWHKFGFSCTGFVWIEIALQKSLKYGHVK